MRKGLLFLGTFVSFLSFGQDCTKIFISEYVEGEGNNKALEIYNPTSSVVQLNEYFLQRYSNGATTATAQGTFQATSIQLPTFSLQPYSTFVAVLDRTAANATATDPAVWEPLYSLADAALCNSYDVNNVMNFNGNDAIVLAKGNASNLTSPSPVLYDVVGKIGEDPGVAWTSGAPTYTPSSGGAYLTKDMSLIRKAAVLKGVTNPIITVFNALVEYDSVVAPYLDVDGVTIIGDWNTLGSHTCNCAPASVSEKEAFSVTIYPNPSNGVFTIKGSEAVKNVQVVNALGQTVTTISNPSNASLKIDLSDKKGLYFVKITDNSGNSITEKVIVK